MSEEANDSEGRRRKKCGENLILSLKQLGSGEDGLERRRGNHLLNRANIVDNRCEVTRGGGHSPVLGSVH